ncbi:hypothetical protein VCHA53O466_140029 [Vibrio chagasii]|nr:hypothetical protein VCHA53O466_140029 [Vibrio chagasii]
MSNNKKPMEKVFVSSISTVFLYARNYGNSMAKLIELTNQLKADYPELSDEDIKVEYFNGSGKLDRHIHIHALVESHNDSYFKVEDTNFFY